MERRAGFVDRIGALRPLQIRDFRLLWTGLTVSMIGDGVYVVAVALQVLDLSNSPTAIAGVGIAWTAPQVVLMLGSGALADRIDRRRLMVSGDLIRLVAIGTLGTLSIADRLTLPMLFALVVVYGVGQAVFAPAFSSIIPTIVPDDLLVQANSLGQVVRPAAMMLIGPLVGGILAGSLGPGWAFVMDGASFGWSAVMIVLMRVRPLPRTEEPTRVWADVKQGLRYVRSETWIWAALVAATVSLLCTWGPWEALVPFVVRNQLAPSGGAGVALGLVFGAGGLGAVGAALVLGQREGLPRKPVTVLYLAWALGMVMTAGFGMVVTVWQGMIVAFVSEGSIAVLVVIWYTLLQRLVPRDLLGRVSSLDWLISIAGVPLSYAIVGPMAGWVGADATLIGAGLLGGAITLAFMFIPGARSPERDGSLEPRHEGAAVRS
ncbi:MAG TPA: MFS transporter [Actinomycetota bacterium]|nr:MFS transporter [Actinomycetota bacterium]